jgi:deferrochelatase/peroxidase EfeB
VRENFGFVDGTSQPILRGTRRWTLTKERYHVIEPGEIILGYPDNRGYLPPSPVVPAQKDPNGVLPAVRPPPGTGEGVGDLSAAFADATGVGVIGASRAQRSTAPRQRPNFDPVLSTGLRDLGRNGTFLVVRQIDQNVKAFDAYLKDEAQQLANDPRTTARGAVPLEDWIASKIVGRWKLDGSSLVRRSYPQGLAEMEEQAKERGVASAWPAAPAPLTATAAPTKKALDVRPDNDFLFGPEDSAGMRCPFGAHIRRANPRDTFAPGSQEQLAITNRHRILRVGRSYGGTQPNDPQPGLLFMCLNADIERQFEFVQQTWLLGSSFNGLEHEADPLMSPQCTAGGAKVAGKFTIPTPAGPLRLSGLSSFTTVKGGGYFFLPGRKAIRFLARLAPESTPVRKPAQTVPRSETNVTTAEGSVGACLADTVP